MKLKDRVAIVTRGAKVAIIDSDKERLEMIEKEMGNEKKEVMFILCDITKSGHVKEMMDQGS